ncbi:oxidase [Neptunitalea chrysea]|uniref:Oxidase n=1 Tax=Neptunitalea chrysea TaxID=1647581 RepID=A0A9W6B3V6_9FLAO|nr:TIGR03364 family FAD-dependent oxidoreductase [Neptunitalea chrysea]GLB51302.1 oxidase [Neptunitalea chrysea]
MFDVICVGAGALGTFHAYHAAKKRYNVAILEKNSRPDGATVRNFGQVVPSGMNIKWQQYGRESLAIYAEIQKLFNISIRNNGTVYIASNEDEMQLLEELSEINKANDYTSVKLSKNECLEKYSGLKQEYAVGGLFFPQEVTVEPRVMINRLHQYLTAEYNVDIHFNTTVINCEQLSDGVEVLVAGGKKIKAKKVFICNGDEFQLLYPEQFAVSDIEITKLQMMQTKPQQGYVLPGSILTGLTIKRYESFTECPSYKEIKAKESADALYKKWGVHILFKQATDGSVILGDSHMYSGIKDKAKLGFDNSEEINEYMIEEAKKIIDLPNYDIAYRWYGMYSQCKTQDIFNKDVSKDIRVITAIGGKGMTGSAGYSKEQIEEVLN